MSWVKVTDWSRRAYPLSSRYDGVGVISIIIFAKERKTIYMCRRRTSGWWFFVKNGHIYCMIGNSHGKTSQRADGLGDSSDWLFFLYRFYLHKIGEPRTEKNFQRDSEGSSQTQLHRELCLVFLRKGSSSPGGGTSSNKNFHSLSPRPLIKGTRRHKAFLKRESVMANSM